MIYYTIMIDTDYDLYSIKVSSQSKVEKQFTHRIDCQRRR